MSSYFSNDPLENAKCSCSLVLHKGFMNVGVDPSISYAITWCYYLLILVAMPVTEPSCLSCSPVVLLNGLTMVGMLSKYAASNFIYLCSPTRN